MSEQFVIILLIAMTLVIVLIALAIPDEATETFVAVETDTESANYAETVDRNFDELDSADDSAIEREGDGPDDARRAADVPEETDR